MGHSLCECLACVRWNCFGFRPPYLGRFFNVGFAPLYSWRFIVSILLEPSFPIEAFLIAFSQSFSICGHLEYIGVLFGTLLLIYFRGNMGDIVISY